MLLFANLGPAESFIVLVVGLTITLVIYFLPTILGRHKKDVWAIFALNLLLGWTFLGWVFAFVWAFKKD